MLQAKYYHFMKDKSFLIGEASRPDKDVREKTSGLVVIGVLTQDRKLTEVGNKIESIMGKERNRNNIFYIDENSYYYLLQFLKLQINNDGLKIIPFIALIYMLEKLDYLTYDEFTYLLPLCKNKYDNGFDILIRQMINHYIDNHKISNIAHEEIMAMVHSDKKVAEYYYKRELEMTNSLRYILLNNNFKDDNLYEKVHIMMGLIDNLCHEIIYHKHSNMNYDIMTDIVIDSIKNLFKNDLV